jgi:hypothetical protein
MLYKLYGGNIAKFSPYYALKFVFFFLSGFIIFPSVGASMSNKPLKHTFFIEGKSIFLQTCRLSNSNICEIAHSGTVLDGTRIRFKEKSIDSSIEIDIYANTGYLKFRDGTTSTNPIIEIKIKNNERLNVPLSISIPILSADIKNSIITSFWIEEDDLLSPVMSEPVRMYEDSVQRFLIYIFHSGFYTWVD